MNRSLLALVVAFTLSAGLLLLAHHGPEKPLVFKSKMGDVTFDHEAHVKREKNDCKTCHPKPWPQSAKAPLNFKDAMHKKSEAEKASCAQCHHKGGSAFAAMGSCNKCHVKAAAKKK
jgi:c(7)-type cytochrome triheme protein